MRKSSEASRRPGEPLAVRRARALARIDRERSEVATSWRAISQLVGGRERGVLAAAQGLSTAVKLGAAAAAIWMAGRLRGPRVVRRGVMLLAAARTAGRLLAGFQRGRGSRWQKV